MLIFLCAWVTAMTAATTKTRKATMRTRTTGLTVDWESAFAGTKVLQAWIKPAGSCARIPIVMIRETPLPMPRSVIWSPIHIRNIVPAVMVRMIVSWNPKPGDGTKLTPIRLIVSMICGRNGLCSGFSKDLASR